jgi:hypothetical protein
LTEPVSDLVEALRTLSPMQRAAVVLHHMAGLSVAEQLEASFSFIDPNGVFAEYQPSCPNVTTLGPQDPPGPEQLGSEGEICRRSMWCVPK